MCLRAERARITGNATVADMLRKHMHALFMLAPWGWRAYYVLTGTYRGMRTWVDDIVFHRVSLERGMLGPQWCWKLTLRPEGRQGLCVREYVEGVIGSLSQDDGNSHVIRIVISSSGTRSFKGRRAPTRDGNEVSGGGYRVLHIPVYGGVRNEERSRMIVRHRTMKDMKCTEKYAVFSTTKLVPVLVASRWKRHDTIGLDDDDAAISHPEAEPQPGINGNTVRWYDHITLTALTLDLVALVYFAMTQGVPFPSVSPMISIMNIAFEPAEYSLQHQIPNFTECWWDHLYCRQVHACCPRWYSTSIVKNVFVCEVSARNVTQPSTGLCVFGGRRKDRPGQLNGLLTGWEMLTQSGKHSLPTSAKSNQAQDPARPRRRSPLIRVCRVSPPPRTPSILTGVSFNGTNVVKN
ncbi:hypothetical protein BKA83DRAFT_4129504 [Pisolithus microcarpus]|nr:hypothetical protein BKA83DRAFT_4129504 [Pisolithus microcarpus]